MEKSPDIFLLISAVATGLTIIGVIIDFIKNPNHYRPGEED